MMFMIITLVSAMYYGICVCAAYDSETFVRYTNDFADQYVIMHIQKSDLHVYNDRNCVSKTAIYTIRPTPC